MQPYGLYIHVPYCHSRCLYCDFYSNVAAGEVPEAYVDALLRDFARHAPREGGANGGEGSREGSGESGSPKGGGARPLRPQTVYFGGGTPGLLSGAQVARVLQAVAPLPGAEITLEANPESTSPEKLAAFRAAGVNRLSFGVQTARADSLARLGRRHTPQQARRALGWARQAGFDNLSGDIMLALPHYSKAEFDETLDLLQSEGAVHISAYLLKVEPNTPFGQSPPPGLPGEDETAAFYLYATQRLEAAGYARYEISNFAQPGRQGKHNLNYWDMGQWLGLGPAAHSSLSGRRFSFGPDMDAFLRDALPPQEEGPVQAEDYIMMRLRLAEGLSPAALQSRFGTVLTPGQLGLLRGLCQSGHAAKHGEAFALTSEGLLVQNAILSRLFSL